MLNLAHGRQPRAEDRGRPFRAGPHPRKRELMTDHDLTAPQLVLLRAAEQHDDSRDYLAQVDAAPADKAAVAEVLGGPGSGAEFLP